MVFSYISWETLCEQVEVETLVQMQVKPHVDKPPGASQVASGLTEQEFLGYLMKKVVGGAKQVSAEGESATVSQSFCYR